MKKREECISLLRHFVDTKGRNYGVRRMALFGSVARGENSEESDVDIAYEGAPNILARIAMREEIEKFIGCKVDIIRLSKQLDNTPFGRNIRKDLQYV